MAWLHATPKPPAGAKRAKVETDEPKLTRLDRMKRQGGRPQMPPNPMPHIVGRLMEIGLTQVAGMGFAPLSWGEIDAWCNRTGIDLDPWEAQLIRRLSAEYIAEGRRAEDETCPPPWATRNTHRDVQAEEDALRFVLG